MGGVSDQHCSIHVSDYGIHACEAKDFPIVVGPIRQPRRRYFPLGPFEAHVPMSVHHKKITTLKGHVNITGHFSCITENVVYCLSCSKCLSTVYIEETGRRLADRFREHSRDVINGKNELPVPVRVFTGNTIIPCIDGSHPGTPLVGLDGYGPLSRMWFFYLALQTEHLVGPEAT